MIDKYINNTTIPATYTTTVQGDNRQFLAKLLINGTEISGDIVKIQITKGSCGTLDGFSLGSVVSSTMVADIKNLTTSVKGQTIECQIGLNISGTYKYIRLGYFLVAEAKKTLYTTTVTAYGATVSLTSGSFTAPGTQTLANIASEIATETGVTVTFDTGITTSQTIDYPLSGITTYDALQALAEAVGGYARDTYDGNIKICKYSATPTLTVYARLMRNLPLVEETDFEITGVGMRTPADYYTSGSPINLVGSSDYVTQTLFNNEVADIVGYEYRPGTIGLTLGDPRIEGNDVLTVTDADNNTYVVPCHMVTHSYTGGFSTEIVSATATALENDIGTSLPITGQIDDIKEDASEAKADASSALSIATNTDQYFWFTSTGTDTGAHITEIPQSKFTDPTDPLYQTGGNLLANSNGIAVRDGMTELATFGATSAQIGQNGQMHVTISSTGVEVIDSNNDIPVAMRGTNVGGEVTGNIEFVNDCMQIYGEELNNAMTVAMYSSTLGENKTAEVDIWAEDDVNESHIFLRNGMVEVNDVVEANNKKLSLTPQCVQFLSSAGTTKTLTTSNSTQGIIITSGANTNNMGIYIYNTSSNGSMTLKTVSSASNITTSTSTRTITLTGASVTTYYMVIAIHGDLPTVS